jgi:predicted helicase
MPTDHRKTLSGIKRIDQLVAYLRDELDWPIGRDDFEEMDDYFFDFTPQELGIDAKNAAKIDEIKRLRPLSSSQPWGIFFVKFEPKRLPVVALRRILGQVTLKNKASSNRAEYSAWMPDDLLFISNYGEGQERKIALAHFAAAENSKDLPVLKVLTWDDQDTALHLDEVARTLQQKLSWPADDKNAEQWRQTWRSAFSLGHREVIQTAQELSLKLAELARNIRQQIKDGLAIEAANGPLTSLMKAFKESLVHDLDEDQFADTYAQTIAYGLLSARMVDPSKKTADDLVANLHTSPFLRELMETFLRLGGRKGKAGQPGLDFDELGVRDVIELLDRANLEAVMKDFGDRNRQEDPVMHFFEGFLQAYDKKIRKDRGVFYTPQPVVFYIVRSVHELLQTEFGLADGLADTTTWGEMLKKHPGLKLPPLTDEPGETRTISPDEMFVQILDPATGTATFLVEVIDVIFQHLKAKWDKGGLAAMPVLPGVKTGQCKNFADYWNLYVPAALLPRLHAYELMMAPYAIAHMKIGLKLAETDYKFASEERARIYLTNALEPWQKQLPLIGIDALAHEAAAVNEIKRCKRFTVVIGNPPYSGISANMSESFVGLVEPYKQINGVSLGERKIWAQDDYKKFIRLSQLKIATAGCGVLGLITNNGFINEPTSRGMRHNLLTTFPRVTVLDLHGSLKKREVCPDGSPDRNVFDIEQGVAISFLRCGGTGQDRTAHGELWGLREKKYSWLLTNTLKTTNWSATSPSPEFYLFVPQNEDTKTEFSHLPSITDVFESGSNGIQTSRDHVVYGFMRNECRSVIEDFRLPETSRSTNDLRTKYWPGKKVANYPPGDTRGWRVGEARKELRQDTEWESKFRRALYRPFDFQTLFYADYMIDWPRTEVMSQMLLKNLSLCVGRAGSAADNQEWNIVFVANTLVDMNLFYRGGNVSYPLRFAPISGSLGFDCKPRPNFKSSFLKSLGHTLGLPQTNDFDLPKALCAEGIFHYIYAVFHSPGYRSRYAEFLKIDFPRLPLTGHIMLFRELSRLGGELVSLHLLESPKLDQPITEFIGVSREVTKVGYTEQTVWINAGGTKAKTTAGTSGFQGVPEAVWNFHIGGYQVCEKWLKDRKGRTLTEEDIAHYHKIVIALTETIRLMAEIDQVINAHGGWPGAFQTNA